MLLRKKKLKQHSVPYQMGKFLKIDLSFPDAAIKYAMFIWSDLNTPKKFLIFN